MESRILILALCLSSFSCAIPSPEQGLTASDIAWNEGNVAMALASLEAQMAIERPVQMVEINEELLKEIETLKEEVSLMKEHVERVYEVVGEIQSDGVGHAKLVPYDPRQTVLEAKTVQEAIDEMMTRIKVLEQNVLDDLGDPGPGLFEIPEGKKGAQQPPPNGGKGGQGQGGQGGQNGPPGNPPNQGQGQQGQQGQGQQGQQGPPGKPN